MTWWAKSSQQFPNVLSVFRGALGLILPFLIFNASPQYHLAAFAIFLAGAITDYFDGWLARRFNQVSEWGKILDPTADKVLILAPLACFSHLGFYSIWWTVPIFVREILITFFRIGWLIEGNAIGAEKLGKVKLVFQVCTVVAGFLLQLAGDYGGHDALRECLHAILIFLIILSLTLTLVSAYSFLRSNSKLFQSPAFARYVSAAGVGLIPFAPGTLGTALAIVLILLVHWSPLLYWASFALCFWAGYWAVNRLDLSENQDPSFVVMDEVLGTFLTFAFIPMTWGSVLAGFFLFRLFDILKPFPLRRLERLHGFWGITLDDLGAGFYAWLILLFFFHS